MPLHSEDLFLSWCSLRGMGDSGWPWEGAHGTILQGNGCFYSFPVKNNWILESKFISGKLLTYHYCLVQDLLLNFHLIDCTHMHVHTSYKTACGHLPLPHSTRTATFLLEKTLQAVALTLICSENYQISLAEPCRTASDNSFYSVLTVLTCSLSLQTVVGMAQAS